MRDKADLRREVANWSRDWEPAYLRQSDRAIHKSLLALSEWREARAIFCFVSVGREPDTRGILQAALRADKRVAVPICLERGRMEARWIDGLETLHPAPFGLLEPARDATLALPEEIDLALIPCVAADRRGYRLGHGGGYYDRYLPSLRCPQICLCRGRALLNAVPVEAHDHTVSALLTEEGLLRF